MVNEGLCVQEVTHLFPGGTQAVQDVSFQARRGAFVTLLGPSGCGKSTLFNIIAGLLNPTHGTVTLDGQPITGLTGQVGYMLQKDLLLPWRSIEDNIILAQTLRGESTKTARKAARELMARCGLAGFGNARPRELSGGMRQRAALIRTLLTGRDVLLLDEPFGALDAITRLQIQLLLCGLWQETGKTILLVTHDVDEALLLSDEIIVLTERPGRVKERVQVSLPRPRTMETLAQVQAVSLKAHLLRLMWQEAQAEEATEHA